MVEKISRKVTFILGLAALSVISLWALGFRMGLDLEGGTRLVYSIDFDKAAEEGTISEAELGNRGQLMGDLITIWRERIDPSAYVEPRFAAKVRTGWSSNCPAVLPPSAVQWPQSWPK